MFDFIYHMTSILKSCILAWRRQDFANDFANDLNKDTEQKTNHQNDLK